MCSLKSSIHLMRTVDAIPRVREPRDRPTCSARSRSTTSTHCRSPIYDGDLCELAAPGASTSSNRELCNSSRFHGWTLPGLSAEGIHSVREHVVTRADAHGDDPTACGVCSLQRRQEICAGRSALVTETYILRVLSTHPEN